MNEKRLKLLLFLVVVVFLAVVYLQSDKATVHADEGYLFDVLENPVYLKTWDDLIATQENVDEWLANYSRTKNGPSTPATVVPLGGERYQLNFVCKAHDCGDNHFVVMFNDDGSQAWGLLQKVGEEDVYFGSPDGEKIKTMEEEVGR